MSERTVIESGEMVLVAPEPVPVIPPAAAERIVKLEPNDMETARARAAQYVDALAGLDPHEPEFERKVDAIRSLGQADVKRAAAAANRMLEIPLRALDRGPLAGGSPVATSLVDLRRTVEDLDPARQGLLVSAPRRLLGVIPFGSRLRSYFARYASAQKHINAVIEALLRGQDELRKDNAAIEQEKASLWVAMHKLRQYALLAEEIDAELERRSGRIEADAPEVALALNTDVLFQVRQKRQDLMTQLAVSVQGYLALDLVRKNNLELIKGVDRATTTTVAALRTAVVVAQALANQKLVLNQVQALSQTTGNLIESTAVMLREQTGETYRQASASTVGIEKLQAAFTNVYAAIDSIDGYKMQAVESMRHTVDALGVELERARTYLDRAEAGSAVSDGAVEI